VNTIEDRLRDAYLAAADTVPPESMPADRARWLRDREPWSSRHGWPARRGQRLLIPFAAAAAVIAVAAGSTVLAQHTVAGPAGAGGHRGRPVSVSGTGTAHGPAVAVTGTPRFFVAMNWTTHPSMFVVNAATGTRGAAITPPFPAGELRGVATGNGRTFVAAAVRPGTCRTTLYRFGLSAGGRPTGMTESGTVPGAIGSPWGMAVAGNGRTVAYAAWQWKKCPSANSPGHQQPLGAYLAVVNTATGQTKHWSFSVTGKNAFTGTGDVSLSADGREVAFQDWVLRTGAPAGSVVSRGRMVARNDEFGRATALGGLEIAPDGRTAYFSTFRVRNNKPAGGWQLREFDLATGRTHLVRSFPGTSATAAAVTASPSGRYLLIEYLPHPGDGVTRLARLDAATGKLTRIDASWAVEAAIAW
jgi:hypothetical protein